MSVPAELHYAESHEWLRLDADGTATVGITDHAQAALGDLVYIELPTVGRIVESGEACAIVESVKAASDVNAPIAGEILAVNEDVARTPETVNEGAYAAWLFKMKPADANPASGLLDAAGYQKMIGEA